MNWDQLNGTASFEMALTNLDGNKQVILKFVYCMMMRPDRTFESFILKWPEDGLHPPNADACFFRQYVDEAGKD
jgi:hypothetical protein